MINLLLWLILVATLGILFSWLAENPGDVTMHWLGWQIDTSFAFLLALAALSCILFMLAAWLATRIALWPGKRRQKLRLRDYQRGLREVTASIAAIASADMAEAQAKALKAEKHLGQTPLTLLLLAQVARSKGDEAQTQHLLEQMLEHSETEHIAARFLSEQALRKRQLPSALALAQRAQAIKPDNLSSVLGLHIQLGQWQEALAALRKSKLPRLEKRRFQGVIELEHGAALLAENHIEAAIRSARSAIKSLPRFAPATLLLARCYKAAGQADKAKNVIMRAWKTTPSAELGLAYHDLIRHEPTPNRLKLAQKLATLNPDASESHIMVARIAVIAQEWKLARHELAAALGGGDSETACRLMAEVEQGQHQDAQAAARWFDRAAHAPLQAWICSRCAHAEQQWQALCYSCRSFDTLEYKRRDIPFVS